MKHKDVMEQLKAALEPMLARIKHKKVIYVDYPLYHNVGDQLIFCGALELLKSNNFDIVAGFSCLEDVKTLVSKTLEKHQGQCSIILQGGGNFGDLYKPHQACRRQLIASFPDTNIVHFPQSYHYENKANLEKDVELFAQHPDLHLMVRDQKSLAIAQRMSKSAALIPDTAHMLWQHPAFNIPPQRPNKLLNMARRDIEAISQEQGFDWEDLVKPLDLRLKRFVRRRVAGQSSLWRSKIAFSIWTAYCWSVCKRSVLFFNQHDKVITSRLHGHILACLLAQSNQVIDNSYGKNSSYTNQWTGESPLVSLEQEQP